MGNVLVHGPDTRKHLALVASRGDAYLEDNLAFGREGKSVRLVSGNITRLNEKPVWPEGLQALPSKDLLDYIVEHAGARPQDRDDVDNRIIRDFQNRRGRVINSQNEVGGYPKARATARKLNIPEESIDTWLNKLARELE